MFPKEKEDFQLFTNNMTMKTPKTTEGSRAEWIFGSLSLDTDLSDAVFLSQLSGCATRIARVLKYIHS